MKKRLLIFLGLATSLGISYGVYYLNSLMPIITGYPAKYLCSAVFISNRDAADVEALDLNFSLIRYVSNEINPKEKSVTSRFLWGKSKAVYRDGFGSVLVNDDNEPELASRTFPAVTPLPYNQDTVTWPLGNVIPDSATGIDRRALALITDRLLRKDVYNGHAFSFLVIHKGIPVAEGYGSGINSKTRLLSWSMAKSFTNALAGMLVMDGRLDLHQPAGLQAWEADDRKTITLNNLLQMESGLEWNEDYGNRSDVTLMLYNHSDFAGFALGQPLVYPPGSSWYYSSGTTNIVNLILRRTFPNDAACYAYTKNRLFLSTAMPGAVFETDATGTLAGSSYVYATTRDYGRFGLLYLRDGIFNNIRILPEGWVKYSATPAPHSKGGYGAFFWLNRGGMYPDAPSDMFFCNGHDGQRIFIIPSEDLVVVILGYSPKPGNEMNFNLLLKDILMTL